MLSKLKIQNLVVLLFATLTVPVLVLFQNFSVPNSVQLPQEMIYGPFTLKQGEVLKNGMAQIGMQADGNLVITNTLTGAAVWASNSFSTCSNFCVANFQDDGNLVLYNGSMPFWSTNTSGNNGASCILSTGSPYIAINNAAGSMIWAGSYVFASVIIPENTFIQDGALVMTMLSNGSLTITENGTTVWSSNSNHSCSNSCEAVFQGDGNLVLYDGHLQNPYWSTGTSSKSGGLLVFSPGAPFLEVTDSLEEILWTSSGWTYQNPASCRFASLTLNSSTNPVTSCGAVTLSMQGDGNLVLYQGAKPLWSSYTSGHACSPSCSANFQADGNLVLYSGTTPYWSSQTSASNSTPTLIVSEAPPYLTITTPNQFLWSSSYMFKSFSAAEGKMPFGDMILNMQNDGNLVLYRSAQVLWASGTSSTCQNSGGCHVEFRSGGSLAVYNGTTLLWSSSTVGYGGTQLYIQPSPPYLSIREGPITVWAGNTQQFWFTGVDNFALNEYGPGRPGSPDFMELFSVNAPWQRALNHVNVLKVYAQTILNGSNANLRALFSFLNQHNIALAVEMGVFNVPQGANCGAVEGSGGSTAATQIAGKILKLGGHLAFVAPDEPFAFEYYTTGGTPPNVGCQLTIPALAANVAVTLGALRAVFPAVQLGDTEPFAGFPSTWYNDYAQWAAAYKNAAGVPFAFFLDDENTADTNWQSRIAPMQSLLAQLKIPYGFLLDGSGNTDQAWMQNAESRIAQYKQLKLASPAIINFVSFTANPVYVLPENTSTSLTYLVDYYFAHN